MTFCKIKTCPWYSKGRRQNCRRVSNCNEWNEQDAIACKLRKDMRLEKHKKRALKYAKKWYKKIKKDPVRYAKLQKYRAEYYRKRKGKVS